MAWTRKRTLFAALIFALLAGALLFLRRKTIADKVLIWALRKGLQPRYAADRTPVKPARLHRVKPLYRLLTQSARNRKELFLPFSRRRNRGGGMGISVPQRMAPVRRFGKLNSQCLNCRCFGAKHGFAFFLRQSAAARNHRK